jgi:hypothetical protein
LGYLLPPGTRCFQRLGGFPWMLSPAPLRDWVHPLVSFTSPSEYVLFVTRPTQVPSSLPGFGSPSRHEHMKSTGRRASHSSTNGPPSTACAFTYPAGLFHPTATSGIRTSGVFSAAKPARLIDESCPHVVGGFLLPASCPAGARSTHLAFRASIRAAIRYGQQAV